MYGQIATVAFVGIEAKPVEVQVRISGGHQAFAIVLTKYPTASSRHAHDSKSFQLFQILDS
jgi:hypothetical protein